MNKHLRSWSECTGCMACMNACSLNCISMVRGNDGFSYPKIDESRCVSCGKCVGVCHKKLDDGNTPIKGIACYNLDRNCQMGSSSGGVFALLAEKIIGKGGTVYGAAFNEDYAVVHKCVDNADEIRSLMGSKYVQSDIGYTYKEVKKDLNADKYVLFSGTPCQIFGLKSFLGKNYDKLLAVEVICHGVPSPGIWEKYLSEIKDGLGEDVKKVSFRDKSTGWHRFSLGIYTESKKFVETCNENLYMRLFLGNHILRASCYRCEYATMKRNADITLGDCWGNETICPDLDNKDGISAVIINTDNGSKWFEQIMKSTELREVPYGSIIRVNKSFLTSPSKPSSRKHIDQLLNSSHDKWSVELTASDKLGSIFKRVQNKLAIELILRSKGK